MIAIFLQEKQKNKLVNFLEQKNIEHYNATRAVILDYVHSNNVTTEHNACCIHFPWHTHTFQKNTPITITDEDGRIIHDSQGTQHMIQ